MASSAALIFEDDGNITATPELKSRLSLKPGTRLELIQQSGAELLFRIPAPMREIHSWRGLQGILADTDADPQAESVQAEHQPTKEPLDWRMYEGLYSDPTFDATIWKQQEREFELAHDERKFGTKRPSW
jgi:hypothetical protein